MSSGAFNEALRRYIARLNAQGIASRDPSGPGHHAHYSVESGKVYARVVRSLPSGERSAVGFVEYATGDILRAATWKRPVKTRYAGANIYRLAERGETSRHRRHGERRRTSERRAYRHGTELWRPYEVTVVAGGRTHVLTRYAPNRGHARESAKGVAEREYGPGARVTSVTALATTSRHRKKGRR